MNNPLTMTPVEFEIYVRRYLEGLGRGLKDFQTRHLENIKGTDGDYEIDVTARFEALGADFLVLVECKRYTSAPVEREEVQALQQKKESINAQKAMMFTTSTFRKGAIDFAAAHNIALAEVTPKEINYAVKSWTPDFTARLVVPESAALVEFMFDSHLPKPRREGAESEEVRVQVFTISILRESLDYSRILSSRGYEVGPQAIEDLKAEITEEEAKLERMRRGGA